MPKEWGRGGIGEEETEDDMVGEREEEGGREGEVRREEEKEEVDVG